MWFFKISYKFCKILRTYFLEMQIKRGAFAEKWLKKKTTNLVSCYVEILTSFDQRICFYYK